MIQLYSCSSAWRYRYRTLVFGRVCTVTHKVKKSGACSALRPAKLPTHLHNTLTSTPSGFDREQKLDCSLGCSILIILQFNLYLQMYFQVLCTIERNKIFFIWTCFDQAGSVIMTQSSIRAFRNWSDRLLEMKTRKVMSCRVQAGASWWEGTDRGKWYRSVLRVPFYHILTLPRVPLDSVWTGSVRAVAMLISKNQEVFWQKFFDSGIKLNELYMAIENHFEVQ